VTLVAFPAGDRATPLVAAPPRDRTSHRTRAMGGRLEIHVATPAASPAPTELDLQRIARRARAWAAILTRHDDGSQLMRLNADPRPEVPVGPTLAAALAWGREASTLTSGTVDVTLLDARLVAETGEPRTPCAVLAGDWSLMTGEHRRGVVRRAPGLRFDLDGVGKGWIADRALALVPSEGALVDADGDIAVRAAAGDRWEIGVDDPRAEGMVLAVLALAGGVLDARTYGVATSGTSIHRWGPMHDARHHLVDPATGLPARSDVVQATVVAGTAREAEAWAKAIVIRGATVGLGLVERSDALGAIALLDDGRTLALARTSEYLA
jgi:thiamine biosynthesis lipoprotein